MEFGEVTRPTSVKEIRTYDRSHESVHDKRKSMMSNRFGNQKLGPASLSPTCARSWLWPSFVSQGRGWMTYVRGGRTVI